MNAREDRNVIDVAPVLLVNDIHRAVSFYTEKLGFTVNELHGEPPSFAMAMSNDKTIMLKQSAGGPRENAASLSGVWDVYLWVRDIDAVAETLRSAGVAIHRGPEKTPYGCTEIEIKDPDGHLIAFGFCP